MVQALRQSRGKHYWGKVIADSAAFFDGLLKALGMTRHQLEAYVKEMRTYRDTFVAHLDSEEQMQIPKLHVAHQSAAYLYDYVRANEDEGDFFIDAPDTASTLYTRFMNEGKLIYEA